MHAAVRTTTLAHLRRQHRQPPRHALLRPPALSLYAHAIQSQVSRDLVQVTSQDRILLSNL